MLVTRINIFPEVNSTGLGVILAECIRGHQVVTIRVHALGALAGLHLTRLNAGVPFVKVALDVLEVWNFHRQHILAKF